MHPWVLAAKKALEPLADEGNARHMKSYMRDQFEFYGIQSGPRRTALKTLFLPASRPQLDELPLVIKELWALPQREYQMVAVDLLIKLKNILPVSTVVLIEHCIVTRSWWDTVDMLATHIVGSLYKNYPDELETTIERWRYSDNLWLRRTTLLYQLKYKNTTDFERLSDLIKYNRDVDDFFIQKAIGWALREYSKIAPDVVTEFIDKEKIEGLARREGLKWLAKN